MLCTFDRKELCRKLLTSIAKCMVFYSRVTYDGETTVLTIADDFNLSDLVYHPTIKDSDLSPAIQLITRFPDGSLRTRYRGTPMNIKVQ